MYIVINIYDGTTRAVTAKLNPYTQYHVWYKIVLKAPAKWLQLVYRYIPTHGTGSSTTVKPKLQRNAVSTHKILVA